MNLKKIGQKTKKPPAQKQTTLSSPEIIYQHKPEIQLPKHKMNTVYSKVKDTSAPVKISPANISESTSQQL